MNGVFQKWDIYIANVPYEGINISKPRPVIVLEDNENTVTCIKMTSKQARSREYTLKRWKESGLHSITVARIGKILELDKQFIYKKIGVLTPIDIIGIQTAIIEFYS